MDEAKFIKEYMELTGCNEATARSAYMYTQALGSTEASVPDSAEANAESATPANAVPTHPESNQKNQAGQSI